MPGSFAANMGGGSSKTAGTQMSIAVNATLAVGDLVVVAFASDDVAGTYTCTDNQGRTYSAARAMAQNAGACRTTMFTHVVTTAGTFSGIISVSHPSLTARAVAIAAFRGLDTASITEVPGTGATSSASSSSGTLAIAQNKWAICCHAHEGPSTENSASTWASSSGSTVSEAVPVAGTTGGGATSNMSLAFGYMKESSASGSDLIFKSWTSARNYSGSTLILSEAPSGTTFAQSVLATATGTAAFGPSTFGKRLLASSSATVSLSKAVAKSILATTTATVTRALRITKPLSASSTSTVALLSSRLRTVVLSATASGTALIARAVGKVIPASSTGSVTSTRRVGKSVTASSAASASRALFARKSLSATATATPSLTKRVARTISAGATAIPSFTKRVNSSLRANVLGTPSVSKGARKSLSAPATGSPTFSKRAAKSLSASASAVAAVLAQVGTEVRTYFVTISANALGSVTVRKSVSTTLRAMSTVSAAVTKAVRKTQQAASVAVAHVQAGRVYYVSIAVTAMSAVAMDVRQALAAIFPRPTAGYIAFARTGLHRIISRPGRAPKGHDGGVAGPDTGHIDPGASGPHTGHIDS